MFEVPQEISIPYSRQSQCFVEVNVSVQLVFDVYQQMLLSNAFDVSSEQDAPPYSSIHQDPVISYPVATLGRLVLPAPPHPVDRTSCNTLPSMIRRVMRDPDTRPSLPGTVDNADDHHPYSLQLNLSTSSPYGSQGIHHTLSPSSTSDSEPEHTQTAV